MRYLKNWGENKINESMDSITLVVCMILFIKMRKLTKEEMMSNLKSWIPLFSVFLASLGYPTDTESLEYDFDSIVKMAFV